MYSWWHILACICASSLTFQSKFCCKLKPCSQLSNSWGTIDYSSLCWMCFPL
uniref:Uncharacterized protein n=1 Tax=Rhizophora mucronata TaxID=61149 RepID=A0A2P2MX81_RHIMU